MSEKDIDVGLASEVAKLAVKDKMDIRIKASILKTLIICLTIVICVALLFAAHTIKYAVDKNYEYLESLVIETETITEEIEADSQGDGNAIAISGNNNRTVGGDTNGESKG